MEKNIQKIAYISLGAVALFLILVYSVFLAPPIGFPKNSIVTIPPGMRVEEAGTLLQTKHVIRSSSAFSLIMRVLYPEGIIANHYAFGKPQWLISVVSRLASGETDLTPLRVTIPEGSTVLEISEILKNAFGDFDSADFIKSARAQEGYLFPDTYFFLPDTTPEAVITRMRENFNEKTKSLEKDIDAFGKSEADVVTMASILEGEARQTDTRRTIAGILWKRLQLKMPLQVDAVFGYILSKSGYAPTLADLKIDSPYNTYLNRGLPPGPIGNPGLDSLRAAITPIKTPYVYYLTDKDGNIYYAKTFEEHLKNKTNLR